MDFCKHLTIINGTYFLLTAAAMDVNEVDEDQFEDVDDEQWRAVMIVYWLLPRFHQWYFEAVNLVN